MKSKLTMTAILSSMLISGASALQVQVVNGVDSDIQLFFRGKDSHTHVRVLMPANSMKTLSIDEDKMGSAKYFEVIASTGSGGDPDWKLLGGTCMDLDKEMKHTLLIEQCALKTSCKKIYE